MCVSDPCIPEKSSKREKFSASNKTRWFVLCYVLLVSMVVRIMTLHQLMDSSSCACLPWPLREVNST